MLSQWRRWGWLFNPITVFVAWDRPDGDPVGAVLEVTNTPWKERHRYTTALTSGTDGSFTASIDKVLHVSPFLDEGYRYHVTLRADDERSLAFGIDVVDRASGATVLATGMRLDREPVTRAALGRGAVARRLPHPPRVGRHPRTGRAAVAQAGAVRRPPPQASRCRTRRERPCRLSRTPPPCERCAAIACSLTPTAACSPRPPMRSAAHPAPSPAAWSPACCAAPATTSSPSTNGSPAAPHHDHLRHAGRPARHRDRARPARLHSRRHRGVDRPRPRLHRGLVVERRPGRSGAGDHPQHGDAGRGPQPHPGRHRPGGRPHPHRAAAPHASPQPGRHRRPLRHRQLLLRTVPRRDDDVLLGGVRVARGCRRGRASPTPAATSTTCCCASSGSPPITTCSRSAPAGAASPSAPPAPRGAVPPPPPSRRSSSPRRPGASPMPGSPTTSPSSTATGATSPRRQVVGSTGRSRSR